MPTNKDEQGYIPVTLHRRVKARVRAEALRRDISVAALFREALQEKFNRENIDINVSEGLETWGRKSAKDI